MSSMFRRVLQRFMRPVSLASVAPLALTTWSMNYRPDPGYQTCFVGRDLEGNKYYEYANANDGRPKRTVQYTRSDDMWAYVASGKRLPVQWSAWLTHTRSDPPSIEELQADLVRQRRVQMNAAILEARDREERERIARLAQPLETPPQVPEPPRSDEALERRREAPPVETRSDNGSTPVRDPWAEVQRSSDEPQSWTPVVRRK